MSLRGGNRIHVEIILIRIMENRMIPGMDFQSLMTPKVRRFGKYLGDIYTDCDNNFVFRSSAKQKD
jgi:hypothetical protein